MGTYPTTLVKTSVLRVHPICRVKYEGLGLSSCDLDLNCNPFVGINTKIELYNTRNFIHSNPVFAIVGVTSV